MHESVRIDNPDGYLRAIIGQCPPKDQLGFLFGKTYPTVPRGFLVIFRDGGDQQGLPLPFHPKVPATRDDLRPIPVLAGPTDAHSSPVTTATQQA
ncbi:uncharacterized protein FTOL_13782 [Fusarium torulosum]|uniref:Uncharacterized protein n=1 Tax=Fusarium torulosum TaxID=33205 RepID=A0AAE8MNN3_9HYPO|nr:uncharacterized protein FTOL_13782 [Fusarium torulosum]